MLADSGLVFQLLRYFALLRTPDKQIFWEQSQVEEGSKRGMASREKKKKGKDSTKSPLMLEQGFPKYFRSFTRIGGGFAVKEHWAGWPPNPSSPIRPSPTPTPTEESQSSQIYMSSFFRSLLKSL